MLPVSRSLRILAHSERIIGTKIRMVGKSIQQKSAKLPPMPALQIYKYLPLPEGLMEGSRDGAGR